MQSVCGFYRSGDWVIREALGQVLRMYDEGWGCKLFIEIKSMYVDSSACVRVKGGKK